MSHEKHDLSPDIEPVADDQEPFEDAASWLDPASSEIDEVQVDQYDIVASPNDWNFSTIVNFIDSGAMKIPTFQRNYVWDKKRASKLIESLLIGLPVPQVFLYERDRNNFLVIDGQQRLFTLYFYAKGRFPRPSSRAQIRPSLSDGAVDAALLANDELFEPFKLQLPKSAHGIPNQYHGLTYAALGDDQVALNLRTIRNIIVKQTSPAGDSAVFEIFSRLNTGSMNLSQQEIRASLYHSPLFNEVLDLNHDPIWREIVGRANPDARMKDSEFLLRALALARGVDNYTGSMSGFINKYCADARAYDESQVANAMSDLRDFIHLFKGVGQEVFARGGRFSGVLFESAFAGWIKLQKPATETALIFSSIREVKVDDSFISTLQEGSTKAINVRSRVAAVQAALAAV